MWCEQSPHFRHFYLKWGRTMISWSIICVNTTVFCVVRCCSLANTCSFWILCDKLYKLRSEIESSSFYIKFVVLFDVFSPNLSVFTCGATWRYFQEIAAWRLHFLVEHILRVESCLTCDSILTCDGTMTVVILTRCSGLIVLLYVTEFYGCLWFKWKK